MLIQMATEGYTSADVTKTTCLQEGKNGRLYDLMSDCFRFGSMEDGQGLAYISIA